MSLTGSIVSRRRWVSAGWGGLWMRLFTLRSGACSPFPVPSIYAVIPKYPGPLLRAEGSDGAERVECGEQRETPAGAGTPTSEDPAFEAFFLRHEQPLYGYLRRMLPTHEVALEVAQEAFFRAWTHFEQVRAYERPESWLFRVATNLAISHLRRRHPLSFAQVFRRADADAESGEGGAEDVLADSLDVEGDAVARDLINCVLRHLSERQRAALLLRAVHGFSGEEIAEMLGVSVANARQILSRGRERFKQLYEEATREGGELSETSETDGID